MSDLNTSNFPDDKEFISIMEDLIINMNNKNDLQSPLEVQSFEGNINGNPNQISILLSKDLLGGSSLLSVGGFYMVIDCPNFSSAKCHQYFKSLPKSVLFIYSSSLLF